MGPSHIIGWEMSRIRVTLMDSTLIKLCYLNEACYTAPTIGVRKSTKQGNGERENTLEENQLINMGVTLMKTKLPVKKQHVFRKIFVMVPLFSI